MLGDDHIPVADLIDSLRVRLSLFAIVFLAIPDAPVSLLLLSLGQSVGDFISIQQAHELPLSGRFITELSANTPGIFLNHRLRR